MHTNNSRTWAEAYHIRFTNLEEAEGQVLAMKDLEDDAKLLSILSRFAESIQSPALQVTGSLFLKRYGLLIAGALHGFIRQRDAIDLSRDNITMVWKEPALKFLVKNAEEPAFLRGMRDDRERRARFFDHLFAEQAVPMLHRLAQVTGIREHTLWGTLSYSIAYWKKHWLQSGGISSEERLRVEDDFNELYGCAGGSRFPGKEANPLARDFRAVDNPWEESDPVLVRSDCCLYYCLPGKKEGHCYTCPKISDDNRLNKYALTHGYSMSGGK